MTCPEYTPGPRAWPAPVVCVRCGQPGHEHSVAGYRHAANTRNVNRGKELAITGLIVAAIAVLILTVPGSNYSYCRQWYVDGSQPACTAATVWHFTGIGVLLVGLVFVVSGILAAVSRGKKGC